jgi:hypothetical protein
MSRNQIEKLALIVGSNPLPNYLVARELHPKCLILYYTPQTETVMHRLRDALDVSVNAILIDDPDRAEAIYRNCRKQDLAGAYLNYTGGTKSMSVHIYRCWRDANPDASLGWASYLSDAAEELRFDDGTSRKVDVDVDLETLAKLHGIRLITAPLGGGLATGGAGDPTPSDVQALARAVLADPDLSGRIHERKELKDAEKKRVSEPIDLSTIQGLPTLSCMRIGGSGWSGSRVKAWAKFLRSHWLEEWVASCLRPLVNQVHVGVRAEINGREFELDVVTMRGYRLHVVSCTTEAESLSRCKSKLFEVAHRARQLGGDRSRAALACLLPESKANMVQGDVRSVWGPANGDGAKVFGLRHLHEWDEGHSDSLKQWLAV